MTTYADRREKLKEYHRTRYQENPEHYRALSRDYYAKNKEIHKQRVKTSKEKRNGIQ